LRKDELTRVHACPQQMRSAEHAPSPENDSNRGQGESQIYSNKSWGYVGSGCKRWDTSDKLLRVNCIEPTLNNVHTFHPQLIYL
jgi:hypothetical protein